MTGAPAKPVEIPAAPALAKIGPTFSPPVRLLLAMNTIEGFTGKGMALRPAIANAAQLHRVDPLELSLLVAAKREAVLAARVALTAPAPAGEEGDAEPAEGEPAP